MKNKYLIIGDVHGCLDELLEILYLHGQDREIIFVGDLIDKGPKSKRCLEIAMHHKTVLGNHEENHLRYYKHEQNRIKTGKKNPMKRNDAFKDTHIQLMESTLPVFDYLGSLSTYYYLPDEPGIVVLHGGILPGKTPEEMDPRQLCRLREVKMDGTMATLQEIESGVSGTPWAELYDSILVVVYGHEPLLEPRVVGTTFGIDTGCVYGNKLTGLQLPEFNLVSVKAKKVYCDRDWHK